jgi:DNA-binding NarL/FixJ family response regulator
VARDGDDGGDLVVVADDDEGVRSLLVELFDAAGFAVLAAARGDVALSLARQRRPAVALLDVDMPGLAGYEVCRRLRDEFGDELAIVLISGVRMESYDRVAGLLLGADDYVVKPFDPNELIARVRRLLERLPRSPTLERLTPRELEVLTLLADGYGQREIGERLVISSNTVGTHIQHILDKLRVHSRAQAVAAAYRNGLLANRT